LSTQRISVVRVVISIVVGLDLRERSTGARSKLTGLIYGCVNPAVQVLAAVKYGGEHLVDAVKAGVGGETGFLNA